MKFAIITGVSKGLGESIATLFLESGINVIGISRSTNEKLSKLADQNNKRYMHYPCDLGDISALEDTCKAISEEVFTEELTLLYVVNNAAVIEPIDQAMNTKAESLANHIQVNTIAPMVLMNFFLRKATDARVPLFGVTVTSGAADRPVSGWSAYCTAKASINMYTQTVALEQGNTENKVIAFNPGIMDTNMQEQLRKSSKEAFTEVETFKDYKQNNLLKDTDAVGSVLVDILTDDDIENGKIYNVADYL
ncbi:(S)-benzoin forming benzil reductase [Virgibacillus sp. NKC19-16]|uniref:(S)-benzoin forming benzil reductase n=1 Tax=Virgibacillus salidurans TaxID=2831673 RepID=UPI001F20A75B|nr:(S)-benzoin forming benzil reductase [Virgibacillus sp. NKC19-16]UJL47542.1 (S)-benzoin forming benzil reductase [Virgibacillus sp. NKC19-16]